MPSKWKRKNEKPKRRQSERRTIGRWISVIKNRPLLIVLFFALFPILFYIMDFLNYSRAGKIALTGMGTIGLLSILTKKYPSKKIFYILLVFISFIFFLNMSFHAVLRDIFGVAQDEMMVIKAIFGTDTQESYEFLLQYKRFLIEHFIVFVFSFGAFYLLALRGITTTQADIGKNILIAWIAFFVVTHLEKSIRKGNPFVYFPIYYIEWKNELKELNTLKNELENNIDSNALSNTMYIGKNNKNTVVWVIGESSTRHNWSLYGYNRNTTPLIDSIKDELLVFKNIKAAAPITVPAFEMMFTPTSRQEPDLWKKYPSIIQIAEKAGYHTYWISNHTTDAYSSIINLFANQADEFHMTNVGRARGEGSYDESVLPKYKKALNDPYDKKLIIVHLLGSHPAYNFRYPKKYSKFTETFDDSVAKKLSARGVAQWAIVFRNLYDNSILYGDYIRYTLLKLLRQSKDARYSSWLYHSDHGEDVAHNTNFSGHNKNAKEQWDVPMVFWSYNLPDANTEKNYSLDHINNSILRLLKTKTIYYNQELDFLQETSNEY